MTIDDLLADQVGVRPADLARRRDRSSTWSRSSTGRPTRPTAASGSIPAAGGEPKRLTTAPGTNNHPRWSPDGKTIAFVSSRGGSSQVWLLPVDGGEARQLTKLPIDVSGPIWSPQGDKIAFTAEVYPGHDPRADRGQGQGEGSVQEQGPDLRPPDDPPLERLGRGEAEPPVRRRRGQRRGPRPDPQARGQHPPCPVRRLDRLRLVARRQGAGLHGRAGQGPRLVHQHRHLDRAGGGRRAQEPDRGEPRRRRPAGVLARRQVARLRQPGPAGLRGGPLGAASLEARRQRDDRRQLVPRPARAVVRLAERDTRWPPSSTARGPSRSSRSGSSSRTRAATG